MPDKLVVLRVLVVSAALSAGVLLLLGWAGRWRRPERVGLGWVLGVGAGFFLGCMILGLGPRWPLQEDRDRFLAILLPAVVGIECLACIPALPRWLAWMLRLCITAAAGRLLLHQTTYLEDLAGPSSREWTPTHTWLVLGGLAAALSVVWGLLALLARRAPGPSIPLALALTCAGAGLVVMLSGYLTGGELGFPLAGALAGAAAGSLLLPAPRDGASALGTGLVGLFGLLAIGHFFGELRLAHAIVLLFAPLLCWLPELPRVRQLRPWLRGSLRISLVAIPLGVALTQAQQNFQKDSQSPSTLREPSMEDYSNFVPQE